MDLLRYAKYNKWAGEKTREVLIDLTHEEYVKQLGEPFTGQLASLKQIIEHTVTGLEFTLYQLTTGAETYEEYQTKKVKIKEHTVKNSLDRWEKIDQELVDYIENNDTEGKALFPIPNHTGVQIDISDFLCMFFGHTLYHRAHIMMALRSIGKKPVGTDYILYLFDEMFKKE
ncbi:MAG: DinB family protein [Candidatus Heimdallarchaeota archaeon]